MSNIVYMSSCMNCLVMKSICPTLHGWKQEERESISKYLFLNDITVKKNLSMKIDGSRIGFKTSSQGNYVKQTILKPEEL